MINLHLNKGTQLINLELKFLHWVGNLYFFSPSLVKRSAKQPNLTNIRYTAEYGLL